MKIPRLSQRQKEWLLVLALFLASTAFWFAVGDFPRRLRVYVDEFRYYGLGESIAAGRGLTLRGLPSDYQKVLYSLFLAPLFFVGNRWLRMHLLALAQAAVMSAGVVPLYLLARDLIRDRRRVFAACLLYVASADMAYSMTLMSEVLFLPLGLWGVWGFYRLLVWRGSARGRRLLCAALGAYVYALYLCKEIAPVFLLGYGLYAAVRTAYPATFGDGFTAQNKAEIRAAWGNLAVMTGAFFAAFLAMKLTVFRGLGGSYDQSSLDVLLLPGRMRYMLYGLVYYLFSALIAAGLLPLVLPLAFPGRLDGRAKKLLLFLLNLLVLSAAVVAYTIFIREDFDDAVPRAHLRYVCYLFPAFIVVFLHQTERRDAIDRKRFFKALLGAGLLIFTLCCFWRGERDGSADDHILLKYLTGTAQDNVLLITALWGVILLTGMAAFAKRPALTLCVFLLAFGTVQGWNNAYVIDHYRQSNSIDGATYTEVNRLGALLDGYEEGNILLIPGSHYMLEVFDTYLNRPNLCTAAGIDALLQMQGEAGTDLRSRHIPGTPQGLRDVRLVILPAAYAFDSDAPELVAVNSRASIRDNMNCNVYDIHDAQVLPRIRLWWDIRDGENAFDVTPEHFFSNFDPTGNAFTAYVGQNTLLYGPYTTLPAGEYDVFFEYRYEGELPAGSRLGYVSLYGDENDLSAYVSPFVSGETSVALRDVRVTKDCTNFETKMWVDEPGVTVERVRIVKK